MKLRKGILHAVNRNLALIQHIPSGLWSDAQIEFIRRTTANHFIVPSNYPATTNINCLYVFKQPLLYSSDESDVAHGCLACRYLVEYSKQVGRRK